MTALYSRTDGFVYRCVAGEHLLLALKRDRIAPMFMLTRTAGFVWEQLDRQISLPALVERVVEQFDVTEAEASTDVAAFLEQLEGLGAVAVSAGEP